jgi:hypothetical protein
MLVNRPAGKIGAEEIVGSILVSIESDSALPTSVSQRAILHGCNRLIPEKIRESREMRK